NFSKNNYQSRWFKNGVQISASYNASYTHDVQRNGDTIALVVTNGVFSDTLIQYQYFNIPVANLPSITSFSPVTGTDGTVVTITGMNLNGATAVKLGGVAAASYTVVSPTIITAVVGNGASGSISVTTASGTGSLAGFTYYRQLKITAFSPASGTAGSSITIKGARFSPTASDNIVYMGAVRATVTSASESQLIVTVPAGASYLPISVTNAGQTAYSQLPFVVTYTGGGAISTATYPVKMTFGVDYDARFMTIADLDGDGKADIAMGNYSNTHNRISVLRNTSTPGNASFAPMQLFSQGADHIGPADILSGDLDGDGKPELIASTGGGLHQYSIF
ncbi:MAG: IPT/TIG domain-containing protein, partial [Bacteroidetes bacterium]|nr:IPT/TIG domain-containing protein [Bacteroidota bacterium]